MGDTDDQAETPRRFVGWSVVRTDEPDSVMGTFPTQWRAEAVAGQLRDRGNAVRVEKAYVPDKMEILRRDRDEAVARAEQAEAEVARLRAEVAELREGWLRAMGPFDCGDQVDLYETAINETAQDKDDDLI